MPARSLTPLRLTATVGAVAAVAVLSGTTGAVASSLVTSSDIKDHTIKGVDVATPALKSFQRLNGYVVVSDQKVIDANSDDSLSIDCPVNKVPVGVGGYLASGYEGVQVEFAGGGGAVFAHNDGAADTLVIQLACASV